MSEAQGSPPWQEQARGDGPLGEPASVLARLGARVIDAVLVAVVTVALAALFFVFLLDIDVEALLLPSESSLARTAVSVLTVVISIAYATWFEAVRGQTVGKMALRIAVRGPGPASRPPLEVAVKRNLWMAIQIVPVVGPYAHLVAMIAIAVTINGNRNGAGWHDSYAGGTRVVKV